MRRWAMRMSILVSTSCVACVACDDDAPPPDPCARRLDAMAERFERLEAAADPDEAPTEIPLPSVDRGEPVGPLPLVSIDASEVRFDGRGVGGLDRVDEAAVTLARDLRLAAGLPGADDPLRVALWVAPSVRVAELVRLLAHAPPSVRFVLLARGPDIEAPAPPQWVGEALARVAPPDEDEGALPAVRAIGPEDQRRRNLAAAWPRATAACEDARPALAFDDEGRVRRASTAELVSAVRACGCDGVDVAAIDALATEALRAGDGPLVRLAPALRFGTATAAGDELDVGADATVTALVARLVRRDAAEHPLWIRAD